MIRTTVAIAILAAATLAGQSIDRSTKQAINNQAHAEMKRGDLLREAAQFDQTFAGCKNLQNQQARPNPQACEQFKIKAAAKRAEAAAIQTATPGQQPNQQAPMYANYDPARAANRQYPQGSRPALPPQMIPSAGQVAQGVWHGLQTGQTTFQDDPNKISGQPAVDFRNRIGGNAGGQTGQSTFGSNHGGGSYRPSYAQGRYSQPRQPYPQQRRQSGQGRYVRGKIVY